MDILYNFLIIVLFISFFQNTLSNVQIPYESGDKICQKCVCLSAQDETQIPHHVLSCVEKKFTHILARWPEEFGTNHTGIQIVTSFSGNTIPLLQQLPATSALLSFSCKHCGIKEIQSPAFIDVPNIFHLDLSWNDIDSDVLRPDIFRGPYNVHSYEPLRLKELDLSYNKISVLDRRLFEHIPHLQKLILAGNQLKTFSSNTINALSSVTSLELLDLSYNNISNLPNGTFKTLTNLKELMLQGNNFTVIPECLGVLSDLKTLNIAENPITSLDENSFLGIKALTNLNISGMSKLELIDYGTFKRLNFLEELICRYNPALKTFDLSGLRESPNLQVLDISRCGFMSLNIEVEVVPKEMTVTWKRLRSPILQGNPWHCDCMLIKALELFKPAEETFIPDTSASCRTPYDLSGTGIFELTIDKVCNMPMPRKLKIPIHDPPAFLRPRSIAFSIITIAIVIVIGLILGFAIVLLKRKLGKTGTAYRTPIRYTTVENTTI